MTDKSSSIKLTSFAIYRTTAGADGTPTVSVLHGASDARFNPATGKIELLADSIPFNTDSFAPFAPKPGHGMLMLYGIRDAADELQKWRAKARELNAEFTYAEFEFDVGKIEVGLTDKKLLRASGDSSRFLNLRRMKSDLQIEILKHFEKYAHEDGMNVKEDMARISQIAMRPNYFDRLFQDYRDARHLDILVIPVADDDVSTPPRIRQAAYVRPGGKLIRTMQGRDDVSLILPAWLSDEKVAKKQRQHMAETA